MGWKPGEQNLNNVTNGNRIGGDTYQNSNGKLPDKKGRVWYVADINFTKSDRGLHRIVYSNDGLVFVSYDGLKSFFQVTVFKPPEEIFDRPSRIPIDVGDSKVVRQINLDGTTGGAQGNTSLLWNHPAFSNVDEENRQEVIDRYTDELERLDDEMTHEYGEDYKDNTYDDNGPDKMYRVLADPTLSTYLNLDQRRKALDIYRNDNYFTNGVKEY
jgi:hypothetical protein